MFLYYIILIVNYLKLAWNLLLNYSLLPNVYGMQDYHLQQLGIIRYKSDQLKQYHDEDQEVSCAVCLCKIEDDDEMRELRCNHLFHKVCLDRWVGHSRSNTCPICRTFLTTTSKIIAGVEVLTFNYCTVASNHRSSWWLR